MSTNKQTTSLYKKRIENIFNEAMKNIENGKKPNISGLMRKYNYSDSSARALEVQKTDHWRKLLDEVMPRSKFIKLVQRNAEQEGDKGASNKALEMIAKVYGDIFPKQEDSMDNGDISITVRRKE